MKQAENSVPVKSCQLFNHLKRWGTLVKFSHTIFALPFAMAMAAIVWERQGITIRQFLLIIICLVSARTAAMGYNRVVDRKIDAANPRTTARGIPAGEVSLRAAWVLVLLSSCIFMAAAALLGMHAFVLSPIVLAVLFFYSWTKRFTGLSHMVLGTCLAMAPGGVWYALTGEFSLIPLGLMFGVLLWVAGFDILYSLQDESFDRQSGLHSIPVYLGRESSFAVAKALHVGAVLALVLFGINVGAGYIYFAGVAVFAALLLSQYRLISPQSLDRINEAFFTRNGLASVIFFVFTLCDTLLKTH